MLHLRKVIARITLTLKVGRLIFLAPIVTGAEILASWHDPEQPPCSLRHSAVFGRGSLSRVDCRRLWAVSGRSVRSRS
jgi:hypothetical protein